jgi:membrane associated rhomboid family serine protease
VSVTFIIITALVSLTAFNNTQIFDQLKLFPAAMGSGKDAYRMITYAFIHADWIHLLVNMYVLYNFGENGTEAMYNMAFGAKGLLFFILLYLGGIATSVIPSFEKHKNNFGYTAVGASGAVSAVVFAFILFPIPAYIFGALYMGISYYLAKQNKGNIGHDAHFFGALFGIMFTILLDKEIAFRFVELLKERWS